jgi:hypothetical protein
MEGWDSITRVWTKLDICVFITMTWSNVVIMVMVFNAIINNISILSWRSVLLVKETRVSGENNQPVASH